MTSLKRFWVPLSLAMVALTLAAITSVAPAHATNPNNKAGKISAGVTEPADAAPSWTGFYLGVLGSYDTHGTEVAGILNMESKDFGFGITLGYNHKIAGTMLVAGIDLDYVVQNNSNLLTEMSRSWSVMPRLGLLVSPTMMLYGGIGYTSTDGSFAIPAPGSLPDSGLTWALGVEAYATKNLRVRLEYRNVDLGSSTIGGTPFESDLQTIRAGLIYQF